LLLEANPLNAPGVVSFPLVFGIMQMYLPLPRPFQTNQTLQVQECRLL